MSVTGTGPAVVFIPGLFGSAFGFRKLVQPLNEDGYRVILIEPLGIGGSGKPEGADYSLTAQADRIAAVLVALEADRAVIVAHSVGASIALRLAHRHPERVAAVVSLDGGPAEVAATSGFRWAMRFAPLIKLFGGKSRLRSRVRSTLIVGEGMGHCYIYQPNLPEAKVQFQRKADRERGSRRFQNSCFDYAMYGKLTQQKYCTFDFLRQYGGLCSNCF